MGLGEKTHKYIQMNKDCFGLVRWDVGVRGGTETRQNGVVILVQDVFYNEYQQSKKQENVNARNEVGKNKKKTTTPQNEMHCPT